MKKIVILVSPEVQLLDVSGPLDVFAEANKQAGRPVYQLLVAATRPGAVHSSAGARLVPDLVIGRDRCAGIDTLLVAGLSLIHI